LEELEAGMAAPAVLGTGALVVLCFAAGFAFLKWKR
jgi:hypothetical protein